MFTWQTHLIVSCCWLKPFNWFNNLSLITCFLPITQKHPKHTWLSRNVAACSWIPQTKFGRKDPSGWCWHVDDPEYHTWEFWGKIWNWRLSSEARKISKAWVTWEHYRRKPKHNHPSSVLHITQDQLLTPTDLNKNPRPSKNTSVYCVIAMTCNFMHDMFTARIPWNGSPLANIHGLVPTYITLHNL